MTPLRDLLRLSPFLIAGATLACQGDTLIEPSPGTLEISTSTGGPEPDADGYTVRVDTDPVQAIAPIGLVRTGALEGQHSVTLEGVAANCVVEGENPRQVTVPAGDTTVVRFTVLCSSTVGTVVVSATTTGAFQPSSGFFITVDGVVRRPLAPAGRETLYAIPVGRHEIGLRPTANCEAQGPNPRGVDITAGETTDVAFEVTCSTPRIAFTSNRDPGTTLHIYVVNPDGSALTLLMAGDAYHPVWSPDGEKIVFGSSEPGLRLMNADGSGARPLFIDNDPSSIGLGGMLWSPDGTTIVFQRALQDPRDPDLDLKEIWRVNQDGSGLRKLADGFGAAWSPDGRRIAFAGQAGHEIYTMGSDGSGLTQVTSRNREISGSPSWSPDGTRIAFASGSGDTFTYEIVVINADGTGLVTLPGAVGERTNPQWSPDGSRIAFLERLPPPQDYGFSLAVMNPDGSAHQVLFPTSGNVYDLTWSPNGSQIAFTGYSSAPDFNFEVYKINADGSGLVNLSNSPFWDSTPSWAAR